MTRSLVIGIDPGVTGAVAILGPDHTVHLLTDLPTVTNGKGKAKVSRSINPSGLASILLPYADHIHAAYLERVTAMPGQGVSSVFSLGDTFGCIRGVLATLAIPTVTVSSAAWKRRSGLDSDKERCRAKAIELFPSADLHRKKDHNRAEALLLAKYALSQH